MCVFQVIVPLRRSSSYPPSGLRINISAFDGSTVCSPVFHNCTGTLTINYFRLVGIPKMLKLAPGARPEGGVCRQMSGNRATHVSQAVEWQSCDEQSQMD